MKGAVTSGERIGHYRVLDTLGEGGMGVVHLGADSEGRNVAIKVLRPAVAGDATARRRLAREVDSMRRVHSPHVAEILDADVTAERPYIVTQYVPGQTLEEVVEESGPVYGPALQRLAVGLASALSAIHGAGIVHRDLKPGNVMLVDSEPVVIDFGIAQAADATRLTATGMVIGTPGYLAPEIIEGEDAGPPSDVHAWAGTLAYAATGRPPFGSGTFESIFYKIMQGAPDLDGVPDALLPVLRSAMARNPAERPTAISLVQLTRRIHIEATITDQTRIDQHYPSPSASPAEPAPDHSRQFSMPAPGPPPADAPRSTTPGSTAIPAVAPTPAPAPAQPSDFVGQLPPAAPPPVPPPGPAPFKAGEQFQGRAYPPADPYAQGGYPPQYGPPPNQPPPGALQRGPEQGAPYDQRTQDAQRRADQARGADRDRERRKPYGWYRLLSFIVLVALLGFANIVPLLALLVTIGGVLVLRMADKAAQGMEGRQTRRGPRSGDAVAAAFRTPLHLPGALMSTVLWTSLSLTAGVILLGVLVFANSGMTASKAIAYSAMAVIVLLCLAPGSGPPRRQLARIWGALLPRAEAALAAALILGIFAGVLVVLSQEQPPDTTPLDGMSQDLESLRADVRDLVSGIPGL
ncbi:serine/threonine-protein kinase [Actinomadura livida]|uniref:Serine/threonine protein kinase n=1 Tax=Actinomadura livida TaxID=79909 RepID=A0A7W7IHE1_9ACTN|nr:MULTISPECIES: serine/threonine-protein kinase [Actinomadura]MBB4777001.1 serine/threonine protein kinase [Actinomadura catellatispora]GGT96304.1 protein kinase [Actinomadura livida]